jgi:tetratricopeptide (TPR) repeat protein
MRAAAERDPDMIDAQILHNLAEVHRKQHQYVKAEASYIRSLEIAKQRLGPAHPAIPLMLVDLGLLYADTRRYSEAEVRFQDALTLLEQTTPALNGRMVRALRALSRIYVAQGKKADAESMLTRAVAIARRGGGAAAELPGLLYEYADLLKSEGKAQEAQSLHAEARRMQMAIAATVRAHHNEN